MTTSMTGLRAAVYTKNSQKMVNPRDIAGNTEEEEELTPSESISKCDKNRYQNVKY